MADLKRRHDGGFSLGHASFPENARQMFAEFAGGVDPRNALRLPYDFPQRGAVWRATGSAVGDENHVDGHRRNVDAVENEYGGILRKCGRAEI